MVIGQVISLFGNAVLRFALPLYLLRVTDSSTLYGTVTACAFVPMVIFSLLGGVIADRVNKRNIMVALDFSTAGVILVFYLLHGMVPLVPLLMVVLMILYGIAGAYEPAVQASIPLLVDGEGVVMFHAIDMREVVIGDIRAIPAGYIIPAGVSGMVCELSALIHRCHQARADDLPVFLINRMEVIVFWDTCCDIAILIVITNNHIHILASVCRSCIAHPLAS